MHEAIIYGSIIIVTGLGVFGLCLYGFRVQRDGGKPGDYSPDIDRKRKDNTELERQLQAVRDDFDKEAGQLERNNTTAREANNKIGDILRGAKKIKPTRED